MTPSRPIPAPRAAALVPLLALAVVASLAGPAAAKKRGPAGPEGGELRVEIHPNGEKASECWAVGGQRQGRCVTYFDDGQVESEGEYDAGERHGSWTVMVRQGSSAVARGAAHGDWWFGHPNGQVRAAGSYEWGVEHGTWATWSAEGTKLSRGGYYYGDKVGIWTTLGPDGQEKTEDHGPPDDSAFTPPD